MKMKRSPWLLPSPRKKQECCKGFGGLFGVPCYSEGWYGVRGSARYPAEGMSDPVAGESWFSTAEAIITINTWF